MAKKKKRKRNKVSDLASKQCNQGLVLDIAKGFAFFSNRLLAIALEFPHLRLAIIAFFSLSGLSKVSNTHHYKLFPFSILPLLFNLLLALFCRCLLFSSSPFHWFWFDSHALNWNPSLFYSFSEICSLFCNLEFLSFFLSFFIYFKWPMRLGSFQPMRLAREEEIYLLMEFHDLGFCQWREIWKGSFYAVLWRA